MRCARAVAVLLLCLVPAVTRAATSLCLTPAAGEVLQRLADSGALLPLLGDFGLAGGGVGQSDITVEVVGEGGERHRVRMVLASEDPRFRLELEGSAEARPILQAIAARIERELPAAAVAPCGKPGEPGLFAATQQHGPQEQRYPLPAALLAAAVQIAILFVAIATGLRRAGSA